jgi:hypothetical protein
MYSRNQSASTVFIRAGKVYSFYLIKAFFAEFKPELTTFAHKVF